MEVMLHDFPDMRSVRIVKCKRNAFHILHLSITCYSNQFSLPHKLFNNNNGHCYLYSNGVEHFWFSCKVFDSVPAKFYNFYTQEN